MPPKILYPIKSRRATLHRSPSGRKRRRTYKASASDKKPLTAFIEHAATKVLRAAAIAAGPDGPYTWILKQTGGPGGAGGTITLAAARTTSQQELGTLHVNLDHYTGEGEIVAAGEFLKAGATVLYNLQSGTYMARNFPKRASAAENSATLEGLKATAEAAFRAIGLEPTYNKAPAGADHEVLYGGLPIIDTMEILTTVAEMADLDRLLSASTESSSSSE
jgi:hypothetical protein